MKNQRGVWHHLSRFWGSLETPGGCFGSFHFQCEREMLTSGISTFDSTYSVKPVSFEDFPDLLSNFIVEMVSVSMATHPKTTHFHPNLNK